jgi:repressor LexA
MVNESDFYGSNEDFERDYVRVPIIGSVSAGTPITAEENIEGYFPVPDRFIKNNTFMLRIRGNSMMNAGIFNNDLVLVKQQNTANDNDIIIALLDDSATCKRFFREPDGYIRLQPENPDYDPIIIKDVRVLGKVTGLFRNM